MASTKLFDPAQLIVTAGGQDLDGWADGTMLTITNVSDAFTDAVGVTGEVVRIKTNDYRATITFRLTQTSDSNDILSTIALLDQNAPNGAGVFPLVIRDSGTGRALYQAAEAWIVKEPDVTYANSMQAREWSIRAARLVRADLGS